MPKYEVWMRSRPGMYEQYDGKIDVYADNDTDAIEIAFRKLKQGAFPERDRHMWIVEKVVREDF